MQPAVIPKLIGIDHIHVYTHKREVAAAWYASMLGFSVIEKFRFWADDPSGPLTLTSATGNIHLALFQSDNFTPTSVLALGAEGSEFMQWKAYLEQKEILLSCKDHTKSWSLYFNDLDNNRLEITSNDHASVAAQLAL